LNFGDEKSETYWHVFLFENPLSQSYFCGQKRGSFLQKARKSGAKIPLKINPLRTDCFPLPKNRALKI